MDAASGHADVRGAASPGRSERAPPRQGARHAAGPERFGVLLRFWRRAFGLSQERLAERADMSVRHISFLENGRTVPSRQSVSAIAAALGLGPRESVTLLLAAGHAPFLPRPSARSGSEELDGSLVLALRHADPLPAMVMERSGRIRFVNKAWAALHRVHLGDLAEGRELNALRLLIDERGWRRFVQDWADVASVFLMLLAQDALMNRDTLASRALDACLALPGVPRDWARRGAMLSPGRPDYTLRLEAPTGPARAVRVVHTVIETGPRDTHAPLMLQTCYPEDGGQLLTASQRLALAATRHPLCPY